MKTNIATLALLLALAPLAACDSATDPATPGDDEITIEAVANEVIADLALTGYSPPGFDELAARVPGFAGYWFDRACNLHVRLTDLTWAERVAELLEPVLRAKLAAEPRCPGEASIIVQGAEFTWKELRRWTLALEPALDVRGVTRMGISVPLNRILVAVTGRPAAYQVLDIAKRADVPPAAIKFVLDNSGSGGDRSGTGTRGG